MFTLALLSSIILVVFGQNSCNFTVGGSTYDLSPIIPTNGSYTWSQKLDIPTYGSGDYIYELSLCDPVKTHYPQACKMTNSPINQITANDTTQCVNLGDIDVWSIDITPYNDGLMLQYYHGYYVNHITSASTIYYIICDASTEMSMPVVEHVRGCIDPNNSLFIGMQYHVTFNSKYACPS